MSTRKGVNFILLAFMFIAARHKTEAVKFGQKPLGYKAKFDRFILKR
ncbi:hypothetical protein CSUNSWCD_1354 [Campylobacter showae CSUNSWCD]|uniref:Uncharacterized protein n=1 Tax=Campylobacter showae CSUNSWCD TaxID=1244083 RepID=M5ILH4_9BACT|nr:hypothetical protein CSUNSWCD_1354 [Campylobacter showae CSUNSWCD]